MLLAIAGEQSGGEAISLPQSPPRSDNSQGIAEGLRMADLIALPIQRCGNGNRPWLGRVVTPARRRELVRPAAGDFRVDC
jgi:hypothetical protein